MAYEREIAMAERLITRKGAACTLYPLGVAADPARPYARVLDADPVTVQAVVLDVEAQGPSGDAPTARRKRVLMGLSGTAPAKGARFVDADQREYLVDRLLKELAPAGGARILYELEVVG